MGSPSVEVILSYDFNEGAMVVGSLDAAGGTR